MLKFTFDVSKLTVAELQDWNRFNQIGDVEAMALILARTCTECPAELGNPQDAATFADADYDTFLIAANAFQDATQKAAKDAKTGEFDIEAAFHHIKAKDVGNRLLQPMAIGNSVAVIEFFVEVIKTCPKTWGKPDQKETYLKLPYYSTFLPLMRQVSELARSPKKQLSKP